MKKVSNKVLGLIVGLGLFVGFTACTSSDDKGTKTVEITPTSPKNTLVITSNVNATFSLGSIVKTGTTVTFNPTNSGKVVVSAPGRLSKVVKFDFSDTEYKEIEVELESKGSDVSQAEAHAGKVVSNEGANATETGIAASINLNGQTNTNPAVIGPYSITVFTPTDDASVEEISKTQAKIEDPVIGLECEPSGATFNQPITINLTVPDSEGLELGAYFAETDEPAKGLVQNGNNIALSIDHFSIWNILMKGKITLESTEEVVKNFTADANTGTVNFNFEYGYETSDTNRLLKKFLRKEFGSVKKVVNGIEKFMAMPGTANLKVVYKKSLISIASGNKTFKATVYSNVLTHLTVTTDKDTPVPTPDPHGAGSND